MFLFFFKQKTAYEMRISDWSSDVCSSDLRPRADQRLEPCRSGSKLLEHSKLAHEQLFAFEEQQDGRADADNRQPVGETERLAVEQPVHHRQIGEGKLGKHNDGDREQHGGGAHGAAQRQRAHVQERSEEHTSELQSLMRISYAVFCLKKNKN